MFVMTYISSLFYKYNMVSAVLAFQSKTSKNAAHSYRRDYHLKC